VCNGGEPKKPGRWFASGLSGAPRITEGGKPPQGVAAINPVMHQEASEEGVHLYSPRAPRETLKRGLGSRQNDHALLVSSSYPSPPPRLAVPADDQPIAVDLVDPAPAPRAAWEHVTGCRGRRSHRPECGASPWWRDGGLSGVPIAAARLNRLGGRPSVIRAFDASRAIVGLSALLIAAVTAGD
jgi:hypothetical protein